MKTWNIECFPCMRELKLPYQGSKSSIAMFPVYAGIESASYMAMLFRLDVSRVCGN